MNKLLLASFLFVASFSSAFAQEADLSIPGEKWVAKFTGYICAAFTPNVAQPADHAALKVKFETVTTDSTLDNGVIRGTFENNGKVCRYSAIILADNAASTLRLVQSKAFSTEADVDCSEGKSILDAGFEANNYLYYGHPHNLAIMTPMAGAAEVCGAGAQFVGVNFVVAGKLPQK